MNARRPGGVPGCRSARLIATLTNAAADGDTITASGGCETAMIDLRIRGGASGGQRHLGPDPPPG
ncbi:hypothetical protein ACIBG0_14730 [Nocardia sp. NPDC050630]|uniref:hypothetical protein n=1 Tax=Nocardia sp. NPDC050630 TaxID=3364321 RepID=UPI003797D54F